jgi:predicted anti-sigma-YlaC factor YlaD
MASNAEFTSGACAVYEAVLEDYLNDALTGEEMRKVSAHIAACDGCASALEDAASVNEWVRTVERPSQPGPAFVRTVMARIHAHQDVARASFWEPLTALAWKFAATSAVVLVLMLTFASRRDTISSDVSNAISSAQSDEVSDVLAPGHSSVPDTRWELFMAPEEGENGNRH